MCKGGYTMSKNQQFTPNHIGTQPKEYGGNKGKKMQDKTKNPQVIQVKGE